MQDRLDIGAVAVNPASGNRNIDTHIPAGALAKEDVGFLGDVAKYIFPGDANSFIAGIAESIFNDAVAFRNILLIALFSPCISTDFWSCIFDRSLRF